MDKFLIKKTQATPLKPSESSDSSSESEPDKQLPLKKSRSESRHTRLFQDEWKLAYFMAPTHEDKPQCVLCLTILSQNRKGNVIRHFETQHQIQIEKNYPISTKSRENYYLQKLSQLENQRKTLKQSLTESECITLASFRIAMLIAITQKPFSEGEFMKMCFLQTAQILFEEYRNKNEIQI